jgi:hypothetical protein
MLSFLDFLEERMVDPEQLASRASRRFGKRTSFGKWEKVDKGGHIPLSTFNSKKSESAATRLWNVQSKLGMRSKEKEERDLARKKYDSLHSIKKFKIADLHATQPFVRTNDSEKLKTKLSDRNPIHIHVVTHKGLHYIADGHHSVMAAKLRGETHIHVNHIDLDQIK